MTSLKESRSPDVSSRKFLSKRRLGGQRRGKCLLFQSTSRKEEEMIKTERSAPWNRDAGWLFGMRAASNWHLTFPIPRRGRRRLTSHSPGLNIGTILKIPTLSRAARH